MNKRFTICHLSHPFCALLLYLSTCLASNALFAQSENNKTSNLHFSKNSLKVSSYDGRFVFELNGKIQVDYTKYNEDRNPLDDGDEVRRGELELSGRIFEHYSYEFSFDFTDDERDVKVKDAFLSFNHFWPITIKIGQYKEPLGLEEETSSKNITFLERALPNAFVPGRNLGIGLATYGQNWTFNSGIFGEDIHTYDNDEEVERWGFTNRLTYAAIHTDNRVIHFGVSASYRAPGTENKISLNTRPESHLTDVKFANVGSVKDIDHYSIAGIEFAYVCNNISLQGEYIRTDIDREDGKKDLNFDGWYMFVSWFLTGEFRNYKFAEGDFGTIEPNHPLGAYELALRFSSINLTDEDEKGGQENNITLGVNWYITKQLKLMANYTWVDNDNNADDNGDLLGNDDPSIFQVRGQFFF